MNRWYSGDVALSTGDMCNIGHNVFSGSQAYRHAACNVLVQSRKAVPETWVCGMPNCPAIVEAVFAINANMRGAPV
eukprot:364740-Chlamydomonas_euryale.AAC.5